MKLNIYNLNEDIYLNIFAFDQNIELQIMKKWFHLSNYLLLALTFQIVQCRKRSLQNAFCQTYQFFSSKKGKAGKKRF